MTLGSRRVNEIMQAAGIKGIHACPKGLRHAFAINCLEKQIPLNMAQKWLKNHLKMQKNLLLI